MNRLTQLLSENSSPRILVCRTDALGDVALTTPVFRAMRQKFPRARIIALCREYTAPVLQDNPNIDQIVTTPDESKVSRDKLFARLKGSESQPPFDIAVILYPSAFTVTLTHKLQIPVRIGTAGRWRSWRFTHRVRHSRKQNLKSEVAYNLDLLAPLGIVADDIRPEVFVSNTARNHAQSLLAEFAIGERFIILHPGSGGSALDWPLERFLELAAALCKSGGKDIILTGSPDEKLEIESAGAFDDKWDEAAEMSGRIVSLAGRTDLPILAALAERALAFAANSTGPLHLAAAVGTPTVGIFPPAVSMSPVRWAPPVDNTVILTPERPACACRDTCRRGDCMRSIEVGRVERALEKAISKKTAPRDV